MIELRHISKSYDGNLILDDVSLRFHDHEMVCLVGSMGAGKSTLLRCLNGLVKPDSGEVIYTSGRKPPIGMIFQNFNLFPHLNILQNLTLAPMNVLGMSSEEAASLAQQQLKSVGLIHRSHLFPSQLSAGQKQRVAIARCLMMNPQIILLDEPLSSLDPVASGEVMDVLRKLKKETTLIMVSHKLEAVMELADRVIFLNKGRVCEDGPVQQVINAPEQEETRRFLTHIKNLHYTIDSPDFDRPELNARIELYCNRFGLGTQAFHFTQLAVEETLNLLPLDKGANLILSKSENEVRMSLDIIVEDTGIAYTKQGACRDELSLGLLHRLCDVLEERGNGTQRIIHLELSQDSLLK